MTLKTLGAAPVARRPWHRSFGLRLRARSAPRDQAVLLSMLRDCRVADELKRRLSFRLAAPFVSPEAAPAFAPVRSLSRVHRGLFRPACRMSRSSTSVSQDQILESIATGRQMRG